MTREEELDWLCRLRSEIYVYMPKEWLIPMNNALDMTIKDLEQKPKTGHWIEEDIFDGDVAYRCSECNELFWIESGTPKDNEYNFCPKCGKRLVE